MDYVIPYVLPAIFLLMTALVAAIVGGLLASPILNLLVRLKSRQTISQYVPEHAAKQGTPTMGGMIVGVGFLAGIAYTFLQLRGQPITVGMRYYGAIAFLFVLFGVIGFTDDYIVPRAIKGKRGLGWMQKLLCQAMAAWIFVAILGRPIPVPQQLVGIFLILAFSNAYNFSDGLDALAGSLLLALVLGLAMVANGRLETGLYPVLGSLVGATIPFLWLNVPPARVFMGDVGSLPIGAVLGAAVAALAMPSWSVELLHADDLGSIPSGGLGIPATSAVYIALLLISGVMLIELIPPPLQILSVKLRKKRLFPMTPIHHAFQKAGWSEPRIVAMFVGVQLVLSIAGGIIGLRAKPSLAPPPPTAPRRFPEHVAPGHQPKPMYNPDDPTSRPTGAKPPPSTNP